MKTGLIALLPLAVIATTAPNDADAKRLGGGRSSGMQRDTPARSAPEAPPAKPAAPAQQANIATPPTPAATPAAAPKRSWLGPLAGLAAGLGLAALMSHLGLGGAFGNVLLIALLVFAGVFVVRLLMRRNAPAPQAAGMARDMGPAAGATQVAWPTPAAPAAATPPEPAALAPATAAAPASRVFVPASFDSESFARTAKMIFIRLQAANDARDLDDLRSFTTPEMFAELSLDVQERGAAVQHTEVIRIEAEVLDVAEESARQIVSVRFRGELREEAGATPTAVDEVWHLTKPRDDSRSWAIAGIEQWH